MPGPASPPAADVKTAIEIREELAERFFAYDELQGLTTADREALFELLLQVQGGNTSLLQDLYALVYDEVPVALDEFVQGRRYLGLKNKINDEKLYLLSLFLHPSVRKFFCAAGSGSGKSFMVSIVQAWEIYNLLCLKRPDFFWMLGPGSKIATVNLSVAKEQAKDVVFAEFVGRISHSPWFAGKFAPLQHRVEFPKNIFALSGGSGAISYFGYHTKMGCVDEAAFLLDREGRSQAEELVEALIKSLTTRFPNSYKLMVISTLRAEDDFLAQNIERIRTDGEPLLITDDPIGRPPVN